MKKENNKGSRNVGYAIILIALVAAVAIGYALHSDNVGYECRNNLTDLQVCDETNRCGTIPGESQTVNFIFGEADFRVLKNVMVFEFFDSKIAEVVGMSSRISVNGDLNKEFLEGCRRMN